MKAVFSFRLALKRNDTYHVSNSEIPIDLSVLMDKVQKLKFVHQGDVQGPVLFSFM
jgi:hypothetical protein